MQKLLFFRHGETDWNRLGRLQGHQDFELNERGRKQAIELQPLTATLRPQKIWSSDLKRAFQTAEFANPASRVSTTALLREIDLGEVEGLTREDLEKKWGAESWEKWRDRNLNSFDFAFPKAESRRQATERILRFLTDLALVEARAPCLALFTHGLVLRSFAQWCAASSEPVFVTPNCCCYEFEWEPRPLSWEMPGSERPRLLEIRFLPDEALSLA